MALGRNEKQEEIAAARFQSEIKEGEEWTKELGRGMPKNVRECCYNCSTQLRTTIVHGDNGQWMMSKICFTYFIFFS